MHKIDPRCRRRHLSLLAPHATAGLTDARRAVLAVVAGGRTLGDLSHRVLEAASPNAPGLLLWTNAIKMLKN
jgi:hypothetical protein